jgi:hypothetical protein
MVGGVVAAMRRLPIAGVVPEIASVRVQEELEEGMRVRLLRAAAVANRRAHQRKGQREWK